MRALHPVCPLQVRIVNMGLHVHVQCNDIIQYTDNMEESPKGTTTQPSFFDEGNMMVLNSNYGPISSALWYLIYLSDLSDNEYYSRLGEYYMSQDVSSHDQHDSRDQASQHDPRDQASQHDPRDQASQDDPRDQASQDDPHDQASQDTPHGNAVPHKWSSQELTPKRSHRKYMYYLAPIMYFYMCAA